MNKTFTATAPGRVNLIGEHTDYNGGFVLPSAIPQMTTVKLTPREDLQVLGESKNFSGPQATFQYELGKEQKSGLWWDYIQGVTVALRVKHPDIFNQIRGFHLEISSNVPLGSGLSSSAALEVSLLRAVRSAFGIKIDDIEIARLGQKAENDFVGARVGVMDQMASSLADQGTALFLDTRSFAYRKVSLPEDCELAVINSGIAHRHSGGDYNTRRSECEAACAELGIKELRDFTIADLNGASFHALPDLLKKRAKHVVTENQRVLDSVQAMEKGDSKLLGQLFSQSHLSMRDDYQVSIPEIDELVKIADAQASVFGARLTGGGFGGSIVVLCQKGSAKEVARKSVELYLAKTGETATVLVP